MSTADATGPPWLDPSSSGDGPLAEPAERARRLALEKSHLELLVCLMDGISRAQGLEQTVDSLVRHVVSVLGGTNAVLVYRLDDAWHYADAMGERRVMAAIDDPRLCQVVDSEQVVECVDAESTTHMLEPGLAAATTWALPLITAGELVGVLKVTDLHITTAEFHDQLPTFCSYAAAMLQNELRGHTRLQKAHDALKEANELLEYRVALRTAELQSAAQALEAELIERHKAEQALMANEERFRTVANFTSDWESWVGPDGKLIWVSPSVERFTGYTADECYAMLDFPAPLIHPEDMARVAPVYRGALGGQSGEDVRFRVLRKDGSSDWVAVSYQPALTEDGRNVGHRSSICSIAERKAAEEALQRAEEQFRLVVEMAPYGIHLHTAGCFTYLNPAAARLFGAQNAEELIGRPVLNHIPDDLQAVVAERLRLVYEQGLAVPSMQQRYRRLDGSMVEVTAAMTPFVVDGQPGGLTIAMDVTEQKQLEEMVRHAQRLESIGRLAGGVAHDLNNLLVPILGYAQLLTDEVRPEDPRYADLQQIQHAAQRAKDLTRQLLAFGRKQVLELVPIDLRQVVGGFEKLLRRTLREDVRIEVHLADAAGTVMADVGQIEQVLMNLCVNAQDAMPDGGKLVIEVGGVDDADGRPVQVELAVTDTGTGIDEETLAHVFEPFYTTKETGRGTGLGLATVQGIVAQHGGTVTVETELGRGTTFRVRLPCVTAAAARPGAEPAPLAAAPARTGTILVVDDDEGVLFLCSRALEVQGYTVLSTPGPEACLTLMAGRTGEVNLLVTDVVMPGLNGRELHERLMVGRPGLKVLYMSGHDADVISSRGVLDAGVRFIRKPFTPKALCQTVRDVLDEAAPAAV